MENNNCSNRANEEPGTIKNIPAEWGKRVSVTRTCAYLLFL